MNSDDALASVDGEIMPASEATIPITDEGLIRGDGVFEVIRVYDGVPFALDEHFARLERSARNTRLPLDLELVRAETHRLLARARPSPNAGPNPGPGPDPGPAVEAVRIMLTRGGRRLIMTEAMPELPDRVRLGSVTYAPTRVLDGVKSLSYAANMLARRIAQENGFDEALLVTPHGRVLEGPTSSVFWVSGGAIFTPPLSDHILASITRAVVLEVTDARERETTLEDLRDADEMFLASTGREVHPVAAIDARSFDAVGPVTARTAEAVMAHIRAALAVA